MGKEDAIVFVVNVAVPANDDIYKDFMKNAKDIMKHMIQKLIFMKQKSEVGIILIGAKDPDNEDGPMGILTLQELNTVSWEILELVEDIKSNEGTYTKWLGGLKRAVTLIDESFGGNKNYKVILISNFMADPSLVFKQFDSIVEQLTERAVNLVCCGTKVLRDLKWQNKLNNNEIKMLNFCEKVGGWYGDFKYVFSQVGFYEQGRSKLCPWRVDLELLGFKVPVRVYIKVGTLETKKGWSTVSVMTEDGQMRETPLALDKVRELVDRNKAVHEEEDTIKGYMCGKTFIPVTEEDEAGMQLPRDTKSFRVSALARAKDVSFTHRNGSTTWLVLPEEGADEDFLYLLSAMKKLQLVALARKIYQTGGSNPTVCVLTPCMDDPELPWCFLMHQIVFADEETFVHSPPLTQVIKGLSEEKRTAFRNFMDTMRADEKEQNFPDLARQDLFNTKAYRALHPDEPLPPPEDYLMTYVTPPASFDKNKIKSCVEKLKEIFPEPEPIKKEEKEENPTAMKVVEAENEKTDATNKVKKEEDTDERMCVDLDDDDF